MANSKQYILGLFPDNNNNEISAADIRIFVNAIFDEEVDTTAIIDNLFSTDGQVPLSANQGRILDDKITQTVIDIDSKEDSLGLGSNNQVLSIDLNNNKIWRTLDTVNEVTVYDGLNSVSITAALSANMGRTLKDSADNLSGIVSGNTVNINTNTAAINTNASNITLNRSDIDANSFNIASNVTNIQTNLSSINTNTNAITAIQNDITTRVDVNVTQNANDILTNATNISTNTTDIATNAGGITSLDSRVTVNETDIAALQGLSGGVNLTTLQLQVNQNSADITGNATNIQTNTDNIVLNQASISNNTISIGVNSSNINTNSTNIANNRIIIDNNSARISISEGNISTLDGRVTVNENDITSNLAKIITNETATSSNLNLINQNTTNITQNTTDIFNNKQDIEDLQVDNITHFQNHQANFILIQNNLSNISRVDQDLTDSNQRITTLDIQVNGSVDGTIPGKENNLGVPVRSGMILSSSQNLAGEWERQWVDNAFSAIQFSVVDNLTDVGNSNDALSAGQGYVLDQKIALKEDDLGLPALDGMILSGNQDGTRNWVQANVLNIDFGTFFGAGFIIQSISIIGNDSLSIIANQAEGAERILSALATFFNSTTGQTVQVDVTDSAIWSSSNNDAFTMTNGVSGGDIICTTQSPIFTSPGSYLTVNGRSENVIVELTYESVTVNSSSIVQIDNTPEVNSMRLEPSNTISMNILDQRNVLAFASYTHGNWNSTNTNVTDGNTFATVWNSNSPSTITVTNNGIIEAISIGTTFVNATNNGITASIQIIVT